MHTSPNLGHEGEKMKKMLLALPILMVAPHVTAVDMQTKNDYIQNYMEQVRPQVMKKLSMDRPGYSADALKLEADGFAARLAECQLRGLANFPQEYQKLAIDPVAGGADVGMTTQKLNQTLMQDIDAGKISKNDAMTMIQLAQEEVQICMNS
jgi:hypothetical protein